MIKALRISDAADGWESSVQGQSERRCFVSGTNTNTESNKMKNRQSVPNKEIRNISQKTGPNKAGLYDLPHRECKMVLLKMFTKVKRTMQKQSENFNEETENILKYQIEIMEWKNTITELKNPLEEFNSRL